MTLRLIDRYLIREIVPYLLLSLLLLTAIIFFQESSRFSELLVVSSRNGLPMQAIARLLGALIPGILVFTLPISLLMGVMVGMGRMSGDSEIIALGASGVTRTRMLRPVMLVALLVMTAMVYITFTLLPRSVKQLSDLKNNQALIFQGLNSEIKPRVFEESIPQKVLYIEDIDRGRNEWRNVFLVDLGKDDSDMRIVTANFGLLRQGERSEMPELFLRKGIAHQTAKAAPASEAANQPAGSPKSTASPESSQTAGDGDAGEGRKKTGQDKYTVGRFEQMTLGIETPSENPDEALDREATAVEEMDWKQLINYRPPAEDERGWRAEIHKRLALPTACLVFALLGVAFGISNVRVGRSFGLILGLAFTICYYLFALSGQHSAIAGKVPVWLGIWQANIVLGGLGIVVLALQRRPGTDPLVLLRSLRHLLPSPKEQDDDEPKAEDAAFAKASRTGVISQSPGNRRRMPGLRLIQLLDRLILSDLTRSFVYILAGVSALFLIITLFQVLDAISRNHADNGVVINYLILLLPMIVNYVTPMAALVAVMVTFGLLQKTSQVVALMASGQSIYRLALPALLGSIVLSGFVFINQDYVLPFTNPRQDQLRSQIRKGQEPAHTVFQTSGWLFGIDSRIFNYAHFEPTTNTFGKLNILDLKREPFGITRRLYARHAAWDAATGEWVLRNGWERRFDEDRTVAFNPFKELRIKLAEPVDYFKKELRSSNSLSLAALWRSIADLEQSGFDVHDMRVALHAKIAFPLACLVMVVVALPFSFSVGKRGALYGVAIGLAIGLVYWGTLSLFEQMGRYEVLPPILAAWGPNLLFGAGGLYLFLTSRT